MRVNGIEFDNYFRNQFPMLVGELDFILGDVELARDVAQEAFLRQYVAWSRLSRYDKPGAWVRRVALRLAFKTRRRLAMVNGEVSEDGGISDDDVDVSVRLDVRNALLKLSETQRAAVVLRYYRDLPIEQVASALGCKESTARVHLHQARQRLAQLLIEYAPKSKDS